MISMRLKFEKTCRSRSFPLHKLNKILQLWHLCSLDAPTVAVVWTWFVARTFGASPPTLLYCAMFCGVWGVYMLDRLLDALPVVSQKSTIGLRERHLFHRKYRNTIGVLFLFCIVVTANFAVFLPLQLLIRYLTVVAILALYFALVHLWRDSARLPKELVVGVFFSVAIFLPSFQGSSTQIGNAFLLGGLCTLNGLSIRNWEAEDKSRLEIFAALLVIACAIQAFTSHASQLPECMALSTILLLILHGVRAKVEPVTLRSCADLSLLTPLLFLSLT